MKEVEIDKSIVVAVAENGCIGKDNALPWRFPEDMKWFKELTTRGTLIMGRKTYESIGRPLPERRTVVITSQISMEQKEGVDYSYFHLCHSLSSCWYYLRRESQYAAKVFIIGGAQLYKEALDSVNKLYLTKIPGSYDGDVFFPAWPLESHGWQPVEQFERPGAEPLEFWLYEKSDFLKPARQSSV
jgi:dihydrofolate reductase